MLRCRNKTDLSFQGLWCDFCSAYHKVYHLSWTEA